MRKDLPSKEQVIGITEKTPLVTFDKLRSYFLGGHSQDELIQIGKTWLEARSNPSIKKTTRSDSEGPESIFVHPVIIFNGDNSIRLSVPELGTNTYDPGLMFVAMLCAQSKDETGQGRTEVVYPHFDKASGLLDGLVILNLNLGNFSMLQGALYDFFGSQPTQS